MVRDAMERDPEEPEGGRPEGAGGDEPRPAEADLELGRWFDGELTHARERAARERVDRDPDAAHTIEFYASVRESVREQPRVTASAGFSDRVLGAVLGSKPESPWVVLEPFVRGLALAASVLLVVSIGLWMFVDRSPIGGDGGQGERLARGLPVSVTERAMLGEVWTPNGYAGSIR